MIRVVLEYLLPLILPAAVYLAWTWIVGKRPRGPGDPVAWYQGPWFWVILAGFVLLAAALGVTAFKSGGSPEGTYVPPRVEGGRIVPGQIK